MALRLSQPLLGKHYHFADFVADEHVTNSIGVASTQMRRNNRTSCHIFLFVYRILKPKNYLLPDVASL